MSILDLVQAGATPLLGVVIWLQFRTDSRIHDIDKRLVRVETKLQIPLIKELQK